MVRRIVRPVVQLPSEEKEEQVKAKAKTAASLPVQEEQVYELFERRDEEQIVATLQGRVTEEFLYEFCRRHKWHNGVRPPECTCKDLVVGISWFGIQEASRVYGGIQVPVEKAKARDTAEEVEFMVEAIDTQTNSSRIGVASQGKMMTTKAGILRDAFAVQKALSKAQRNAIKQLLPQTMLKEWIQKHRNGGSGKSQALQAAGSPAQPAGPHPLDAKAQELKEQLRALTGSDDTYLNTLGLHGGEELSQLDIKSKANFVNELMRIAERLKARAA